MKIHYLQHVPFEGLGSIGAWARNAGYPVTSTRLYHMDVYPDMNAFDWLIVMGGPMSVHDRDIYPWLTGEKKFIRQAIDRGKIVLGICLGAQLIAHVLRAKVYSGSEKEIGWFPIERSLECSGMEIAEIIPDKIDAFHWHGETFELPYGATRLAGSAVYDNQAFVYQEKVLGLQFHLEATPDSVKSLIEHCADEITAAPYIQSAAQMLSDENRFVEINRVMDNILNYLKGQYTLSKLSE